MARVTFVGTGEAFDPDLPNTSVLYQGSATLLVDVGYAVPHALWRVTRDPNLLDAVYLTHRHADHAMGLPPLLLWMRDLGRQRPLSVIGGPGIEHYVRDVFELAYPGSFEKDGFVIEPRELGPGASLRLGNATLSCAESRHSLQNLSLRIDDGAAAVCVSGDGGPTDATRELFRGATLLSHECYTAQATSKNHATVHELLTLAEAAQVGTLALVHFARDEKEAIRARARAHDGAVRVVLPAPGDVIEVGGPGGR